MVVTAWFLWYCFSVFHPTEIIKLFHLFSDLRQTVKCNSFYKCESHYRGNFWVCFPYNFFEDKTTYVLALGASPMEDGVVGQPDKTLYFHHRHRDPPSGISLQRTACVSGLTASAPVSDVSAPACTNGYVLFCGLWVWHRRTNRRPCCPPMSNPSTYPWTARPYGSGRLDNLMFNTFPDI